MFKKKYATYAAVADTNVAVAAKLERMAAETSDPELRASWSAAARDARQGRLHPRIRRDFATGTRYSTGG